VGGVPPAGGDAVTTTSGGATLTTGRRDPSRRVVLDMPAGFPEERLDPLFELDDHGRPLVDVSREYRLAVTRNDPLIFALVYLSHHLIVERGEVDLIAISEWHLDLVQSARTWISGKPRRDAWIAPRKGAKSTWLFVILALWALAHGHRRFVLAFAHNSEQAIGHLNTLRAELSGNPLLVEDFPELEAAKTPGARDSMRTVTRGGATMAARGIDSQALGIKSGAQRPDLILLDDIEPGGSAYSMNARGKRLATLVESILPMNEDAIVQLAGTVTMLGSITHDLVLHAIGERTAAWIVETEFEAHYYPAIIPAGGGRPERSLWPAMWSLAWLKSKRGTPERPSRSFALNYMNRPEGGGGLYWTHDLIVHDPHFQSAHYVLTVDTAVTQGARSDMTAIVITGISADGRRMCVEYAFAGRITGTELRAHMWALKAQNPTLTLAYVEGNQGGDRWREILSPMPEGLALEIGRPDRRGSKRDRCEWLLDQYARGAVVHRSRFGALEDQMLAWPNVAHDDLLDAVEAGVAFHMGLPMGPAGDR
jgi:phage terminase large subunit-like protein